MATIAAYNKLVQYIGDGTIDIDNAAVDAFKLALMGAGHIRTLTNTAWAQVSSNEIGAGNGYVTKGEGLTGVSWSENAGVVTWTADATTWNASGGPITAYHGVYFYEAGAADELMLDVDFEGEESAGDGTPFVVTPSGSGLFTIG